MTEEAPTKWGVYHVWAPLARPRPTNKYVVVVCRLENGHYGTFPISTHMSPLAAAEDAEGAYARLNGARYREFMTEPISWVSCQDIWPFRLERLGKCRATLRPDDREAIIAAKDFAPALRRIYKALISLEGDWE